MSSNVVLLLTALVSLVQYLSVVNVAAADVEKKTNTQL